MDTGAHAVVVPEGDAVDFGEGMERLFSLLAGCVQVVLTGSIECAIAMRSHPRD